MNNKLPVAGIEQLVDVCHVHSANKQFFEIAWFKPTQPLMMNSGTSKCFKTMNLGQFLAQDSAEQKAESAFK